MQGDLKARWFDHILNAWLLLPSNTYAKPCQTSKVISETINDFKPLTVVRKTPMVDVWQGS